MAYPTGELLVDLHAIADNWRIMDDASAGSETAAVVKANAYGLGVERVAPKIYKAGCRHFFVANLKEAMQLKSLVGLDAAIYVLTGCIAGAESVFVERGLIPVIVSSEMLNRWLAATESVQGVSAVLKVNTGMARMGLEPAEFDELIKTPELFEKAGIKMLMSHLACADEPTHELNVIQKARFDDMLNRLQTAGVEVQATLANSAGIWLNKNMHHDLVRPGIALYGGNPVLAEKPMRSVVGLRLPIIQVRDLPKGEYVGYGATRAFDSPRRIAVAAGGYADGIFRSLSNRGCGWLAGIKVPIVGRISMDSTLFDVTGVDPVNVLPGQAIELLGEHISIDDLAESAGTISYEVLTSFGARYQRCYVG